MNDEQMLELLRRQPEAGLQALLQTYGSTVQAVVRRILPARPEDVEECTADAFIRVWKHADRIEAQNGTLKGYLICAARSTAIDRYRKLKREQEMLPAEEELLSGGDFVEGMESEQGVTEIRQLVEQLKQPDREILLRRYFLYQSVKEVAAAMKLGEKAVESRLFRGRKKLQQLLQKERNRV